MENQLSLFEDDEDLYFIKGDTELRLTANIPNTILFRCECGQQLTLDFKNWGVNIVGVLQVRCPYCKRVISSPGLWKNEDDA